MKQETRTETGKHIFLLLLLVAGAVNLFPPSIVSAEAAPEKTEKAEKTEKSVKNVLPGGEEIGKLPTFIRSNTLSLKAEERIFLYEGNVEVRQGDMILTSDALEGKYNEKNEIEQLVAKSNVVITRGETLKASSEKAIYETSTETVTLSENPELQQNGSVLTADSIKLFLKDNHSTAEGSVRVKLVKEGEAAGDESSLLGLSR